MVDVCLRVKKGTADTTPEPYDGKGKRARPLPPVCSVLLFLQIPQFPSLLYLSTVTEPEFDVKIMNCVLASLDALSAVRIHMNNDLRPMENRTAVGRSLREVERRLKNEVSV